MAQIAPSMFAGHDISCPYEDKARGESGGVVARSEIEERSFDYVRAPAQTAGRATTRANSAQDDGERQPRRKKRGNKARLPGRKNSATRRYGGSSTRPGLKPTFDGESVSRA